MRNDRTNVACEWHVDPEREGCYFRTFHDRPDGTEVYAVESGTFGAPTGFGAVASGFYWRGIGDGESDTAPFGPYTTASAAMRAADEHDVDVVGCTDCGAPATVQHVDSGQRYCAEHAPRWNVDDSPSTVRVEWTIGAVDDPHRERGECSLAEWIESNRDGVSLADVRDLLTRGECKGGGGAACEWSAALCRAADAEDAEDPPHSEGSHLDPADGEDPDEHVCDESRSTGRCSHVKGGAR